MTEVETVASQRIMLDATDTVVDIDTKLPFDVAAYSAMKYGNREITRQFARALTDLALETRKELVEEERPPLFVSSFSVVPPTPFHISNYTLETINEHREANGFEPGRVLRVDKSRTQTSNYAKLTKKQSKEEWNGIDLFFTTGEAGRPSPDTQVVILDDIRITGAFTDKLLGVFEGHNPKKMMLGFVAIFEPKQADERPDIEDVINGTATKSVEDVLAFIEQNNFDLNIRTLKMILSTKKPELQDFLDACPPALVEKMYSDTQASGSDFIEYHAEGYRTLQEMVWEKLT